jgi:hypothetical protein
MIFLAILAAWLLPMVAVAFALARWSKWNSDSAALIAVFWPLAVVGIVLAIPGAIADFVVALARK